MDPQDARPEAPLADLPHNGSDAPHAEAAREAGSHTNVNFVVRFGFSPPGWQRAGAQEEADENRSGGDALSRSSASFSSGDGSVLGAMVPGAVGRGRSFTADTRCGSDFSCSSASFSAGARGGSWQQEDQEGLVQRVPEEQWAAGSSNERLGEQDDREHRDQETRDEDSDKLDRQARKTAASSEDWDEHRDGEEEGVKAATRDELGDGTRKMQALSQLGEEHPSFGAANGGAEDMHREAVDRESSASDGVDRVDVVVEDDEPLYEPPSLVSKSKGSTGTGTGEKQLLSDKPSHSSFASTSASGPTSWALSSSTGSSWQPDTSFGSFASAGDAVSGTDRKYFGLSPGEGSSSAPAQRNFTTEGGFARRPGRSRPAPGALGPLLEVERQQGEQPFDIEAEVRGTGAASAPINAEVVRAPVAWRVACPAILLALVVGSVIAVLLVSSRIVQEA